MRYSPRRFRNLKILIAILLIYLLRSTNKALATNGDASNGRTSKETSELVRLIGSKYGAFLLERNICMSDGTCVDIRDDIVKDGNEYRMVRRITVGTLEITGICLQPPKDLNLEKVDTRKWKVDKGAYQTRCYTHTMIDEMFLSGAVEMRKDSEARVLALGMGGGFVNSFLHHNFPQMNITVVELEPKMAEIAKKWFDLELDRRHHLHIGDAMEFVRDAVAQALTFDAVLLDACSTKREVLCPIREMITESSAKWLSKVLSERGVLIANVFSRSTKISHIGAQLKFYYSRVFKHCMLQKTPISNLVFTCTQFPRPEGLQEKYREFNSHKTTRTPNIEL